MLVKLRSVAKDPSAQDTLEPRPRGTRVCLVTALTVADFLDPELTLDTRRDAGAQLGVLTLAAILRQEGFVPHVVNLDRLFYDFLRQNPTKIDEDRGGKQDAPPAAAPSNGGAVRHPYFFSFVAEHLRNLDPALFEVVGLSSICSSYPLTVRLAEEVKRLRPNATVILGGVGSSRVDLQACKLEYSIVSPK